MLNIMLGLMNTFVIKGTYIYFGYHDKRYVISKHLIVDVFGVCAKGYVEDLKREVSKIVTCRHYRVVELHTQILQEINGM
jgi:hypothetical protein